LAAAWKGARLRIVLDLWIAAAESGDIRQLMKFARALQTHSSGEKPTEIETSSSSNFSHYVTLSTR